MAAVWCGLACRVLCLVIYRWKFVWHASNNFSLLHLGLWTKSRLNKLRRLLPYVRLRRIAKMYWRKATIVSLWEPLLFCKTFHSVIVYGLWRLPSLRNLPFAICEVTTLPYRRLYIVSCSRTAYRFINGLTADCNKFSSNRPCNPRKRCLTKAV